MKKITALTSSLILAGGWTLWSAGFDPGIHSGLQSQSAPQSDSQKSRDANDPTKNNPDVPHQEPGTDNPDVGKQRHPTPGGTGEKQQDTTTKQAKKKPKPRKDTSSESPK